MIKTKCSSGFFSLFVKVVGWPTSVFFDARLVDELDG